MFGKGFEDKCKAQHEKNCFMKCICLYKLTYFRSVVIRGILYESYAKKSDNKAIRGRRIDFNIFTSFLNFSYLREYVYVLS